MAEKVVVVVVIVVVDDFPLLQKLQKSCSSSKVSMLLQFLEVLH
jgi:hypothetical protein